MGRGVPGIASGAAVFMLEELPPETVGPTLNALGMSCFGALVLSGAGADAKAKPFSGSDCALGL